MTDYVRFKDLRVNDNQPSYTLEESVKRPAALGGIHSFDFLSRISEIFAGSNSDIWAGALSNFDQAGAEGTWTINTGKIQGTGGGGGRWYRIQHNTEVAPSFVATFDKFTDTGGFLFCTDYLAFWSGSAVGFAKLNKNNGVQTLVVNYADAYTGEGEVAVAVRYQSQSSVDQVDWLSASMYIDGRCVASMSDEIVGMLSTHEIGFATYAGNVMQVDNLRIAELRNIVDWTSVDPGEAISSGMNRAIGTAPVFYFVRYDGTLRMWTPENRAVDWTVPADRIRGKATRTSYFVPAHVRMVGAYHEASEWDQEDAEKQARQLFTIADDPNLMSDEEAYRGAQRARRKLLEGAEMVNLTMPGCPLIEPQDRISDGVDDMRVAAIQFAVMKKKKTTPVIDTQLECTKYEAT